MPVITVAQDFTDGSLAEAFAQLGYPAKWKRGEKRNIPESLIKRIVSSGGIVTIPDDNAKESKLIPSSEPVVPMDEEAHYRKLYSKEPKVRVVFPEGFTDGTLSPQFNALDHPATFGAGEIFFVPTSLLERIHASGGLVETNPFAIDQYRNNQGKHQIKVEQWQAEREQQKAMTAQAQENAKANTKLLAEIEKLSARFLKSNGTAREALWQRINELQAQLQ